MSTQSLKTEETEDAIEIANPSMLIEIHLFENEEVQVVTRIPDGERIGAVKMKLASLPLFLNVTGTAIANPKAFR